MCCQLAKGCVFFAVKRLLVMQGGGAIWKLAAVEVTSMHVTLNVVLLLLLLLPLLLPSLLLLQLLLPLLLPSLLLL